MTPLLEARGLVVSYWRLGHKVEALAGVDIQVPSSRTTALVGRSGSGKSTLARALALLERPDAGEILLDGQKTATLKAQELAAARRSVQLVVQDPARAVNPRFTVVEAVAEPLQIVGVKKNERHARAVALLEEVGLDQDLSSRPARRLSGGQVQRLAIARALACEPRALILDEALGGLDLSVRARLVGLLGDLQERHGLTYLVLSHDRALVHHVADHVYELEAGRVARSFSPTRGTSPAGQVEA